MRWRLSVVAFAGAAAIVPLPASLVERIYARRVFAVLQPVMTRASNLTSVALLDLLIVAGVVGWVALACALV